MKTKQEALEALRLLKSINVLAEINKLQNTFIKAFKNKSIPKADGRHYLHGNFNLGGTVSGRMSSSNPNLQNLPSTGTIYAKKFKKCFVAPEGWVLIGADFSSLEDRIAALTTKDPNKLKVYEDGYDGHCLRAYAYFKDQMPDIRQIPENSALKTYCANVNGTDICFTSGDTIKYKNSAYTGEEFYELFTNNRL